VLFGVHRAVHVRRSGLMPTASHIVIHATLIGNCTTPLETRPMKGTWCRTTSWQTQRGVALSDAGYTPEGDMSAMRIGLEHVASCDTGRRACDECDLLWVCDRSFLVLVRGTRPDRGSCISESIDGTRFTASPSSCAHQCSWRFPAIVGGFPL
jgi:hypothetical protein